MLARLPSAALRGLQAEPVDVEVDLSRGLPAWNMVGLPEAAVRDRVRSALLNSGFEFPLRHITVNLSPADRRKDGAHFDLPVAMGLLLASGQFVPATDAAHFPFMIGELSLDGRLNPVPGILPPLTLEQRLKLARMQPGESSRDVAARVLAACQRQYERLGEGEVNARMSQRQIEHHAHPDEAGARLLDRAMQRFSLSARSYHRILKVARSIADLSAAKAVTSEHVAEALQYRGEGTMAW